MKINMCFGGGGYGKMTKNIFYIWKDGGEIFMVEGDVDEVNSEVWVLNGVIIFRKCKCANEIFEAMKNMIRSYAIAHCVNKFN